MSSFAQVKNLFEESEITTEVVRKSIHMLIALVPPLAAFVAFLATRAAAVRTLEGMR